MTNIIKGSGGGCFRKGSKVQIEGGLEVAIEDIKIGDEVLGFDENGDIHVVKVSCVHYHADPQPILRVKFWRGEVFVTPNHWVLNQYNSFVEIGTLSVEDALVDGMGHLRPITSMELIGYEPVWNLTVEPHHTFICSGIRVHNGGHRETYPVVKGSGGGGGKGGGGGGRVAQEAPNTLQSVQIARVLDLVSEGEIEGLVNGLNSVYINDTPLLNDNGSYNFSGVAFDYRVGTQGQTYIPGFPSIENEVAVSTEIKNALPVVRSITNPNINATRITVSVPSLTSQDVTNGDLNGTSVTLKVDIQNNYGGYVPAKLSVKQAGLSVSGQSASSGSTNILSANLSVNWTGVNSTASTQFCTYIVEYRSLPSGAWTNLVTNSVSGVRRAGRRLVPADANYGMDWWVTDYFSPSASQTIQFQAPLEGAYEFRVVKVSGTGSVSFGYGNANYYSPEFTISGKTTSRYQRSLRLELPSPGPWDIKVTRVTPDSTSAALQNATYFESYTEIIDAKLSYPNSAVFGVQIDSRQFNSVPSRAYEIYGIKVKVPDNYDPFTREYTGEWGGDFKIAWTDNPAWIFYDIVSNDRYGLGQFIDAASIDKWGLYSIAKYCDGLVSNGLGGVEPRFTCNAFIQTRSEAYSLITQIASIFRAMVVWSAGQITCVQDKPADVVGLFTAANVIDGQFNYSGSSAKTRHTVCLVTWNDPKDRYRQKVEYVEDSEGIARYGVIQTEVNAFGCTSRGQAHRFGRWLLFSERLETETVTFKAGMDAALVYPGAIIHTQDQFRSGKRFGGRTFNSTASSITLDSEVQIESGKTYEVSIILPNGEIESRQITNSIGTTSTLNLSSALSDVPVAGAIWVLSASDLFPEEWRVVSISEVESGIVEITGLASRQDKFEAIENNLVLDPLPTIGIGTSNDLVYNINITESLYLVTPVIVGASATVSWVGTSASYIVSYTSETQNTVTVETLNPSYTFNGISPGVYTFSVQPVNALGQRGITTSTTKEIYGLIVPPDDVSGFAMSPVAGSAYITFDPSTDLDVKVGGYLRLRHSRNGLSWNDAIDINTYVAGTSTSAVVPLLDGTYFAKWVDSSGIESVNAVSITTNAPSIIKLNFIETLQEHPDFLGNKVNVGIDEFAGEPCLLLDSTLTVDEMLSEVDYWPSFDAYGGTSSTGTYAFYGSIDLGEVYTSRVTADLVSYGINYSNLVDLWGPIDSLSTIDGDVIADVSARLYIKHSQDGVSYTNWEPLFVGDYYARYMEFKLVMNSDGNNNNIAVTRCTVSVDMPDTIFSEEDIESGLSTYSVIYPVKFYSNPALGITAQDMQTGDYYEITNKSNVGFDVVFKNTNGEIISRTFDYIAKGY